MGWDIKGWLFGRSNNNDDYKKEAKQLRRDLNNQTKRFNKILKDQRNDAKVQLGALEDRNEVLLGQLDQLRIDSQTLADGFQDQLDDAATARAEAAEQSRSTIDSLNDLIIQNRDAFEAQQAQLTSELEASRAETARQAKITANIGRAYVPDALASAAAPELSDGSVDSTKRKLKDNELSTLSIVPSPSGDAARRLAGLQIA